MEKWYQKLKRGDVWWVCIGQKGDGIVDSSVERKSRPYLIISNDMGNKSSPIVNAIPITTRNKDNYPMHVYFRNEEQDRNQVILCEQIMTLSIKLFDRSQSYFMYTLDEKLMEKVDTALALQLNLNVKPVELRDLERLVSALADAKLKEIQRKASRQEELKVLVDSTVAKFRLSTPDTSVTEVEEQVPAKYPCIRRTGDPWTTELKERYIQDVTKYSKNAVCAMYGLKPLSVTATYRRLKKELATAEKA